MKQFCKMSLSYHNFTNTNLSNFSKKATNILQTNKILFSTKKSKNLTNDNWKQTSNKIKNESKQINFGICSSGCNKHNKVNFNASYNRLLEGN